MNQAAGTNGNPISKKQIRFIRTVQRRNMEDSAYYDTLSSRFGVDSTTKLTSRQASQLIKLFKSWGYIDGGIQNHKAPGDQKKSKTAKKRRAPHSTGKVIKLASAQQKTKIDVLIDLIGWRFEDAPGNWMEKRFGITRVVTAHDAYLVIEGLKKVFEHKMDQLHGKNWWAMDFTDPMIGRYIREHRPAGRL